MINLLENDEITEDNANKLLLWMYEHELQVIPSTERDYYDTVRKSLTWTDGYLRPDKIIHPVIPK